MDDNAKHNSKEGRRSSIPNTIRTSTASSDGSKSSTASFDGSQTTNRSVLIGRSLFLAGLLIVAGVLGYLAYLYVILWMAFVSLIVIHLTSISFSGLPAVFSIARKKLWNASSTFPWWTRPWSMFAKWHKTNFFTVLTSWHKSLHGPILMHLVGLLYGFLAIGTSSKKSLRLRFMPESTLHRSYNPIKYKPLKTSLMLTLPKSLDLILPWERKVTLAKASGVRSVPWRFPKTVYCNMLTYTSFSIFLFSHGLFNRYSRPSLSWYHWCLHPWVSLPNPCTETTTWQLWITVAYDECSWL